MQPYAGFQMLYADSYMSRDEFRKMFDHSHYDEMKAKYDPDGGFPEPVYFHLTGRLAFFRLLN